MNCQQVESELPLYHYGELLPELEERMEQHLAVCAGCTESLKRFRALARALSAIPVAQTNDELLSDCRAALTRAIRNEPSIRRQSWTQKLQALMGMGIGIRIPAGAVALIAVGFLAGKLVPGGVPFLNTGARQAGFVSVRGVEPDESGGVRIAFDRVSRGNLTGPVDDPRVRELLMTGMRDESNPGLRVEACDILKSRAGESAVRQVLVQALLHDPNVGVRLNALEGLRPYAAQEEVREALTQALLNDANPGVRVKVIDLLSAHKDDSMVGPLQNLMQKEDNGYVRMRITNVLRDLNASVGTF